MSFRSYINNKNQIHPKPESLKSAQLTFLYDKSIFTQS